jgi:hypothetical protein
MSRHLVFVHGRDFKPRAELLWQLWEEALGGAIQRHYREAHEAYREAEKSFVYFGDLTHRHLTDLGREYDEETDLADRQHALALLTPVKKRDFLQRRLYEGVPGHTPLKEFLADVGLPILNTLRLAERAIARFAPEYGAYWEDQDGFGTEVRARLRNALATPLAAGEEIMLVTHCLGSLAAYDVLWQLSHESSELRGRISLWLTLGSPLGDEAAKRHLMGAKEPASRRYPSMVTEWVNVAAEDDYISHDKTVADDFDAWVRGRQISRIRDYKIYNLTSRFGKSNPHSSVGFLCHPRVAKVVSDWVLRASS